MHLQWNVTKAFKSDRQKIGHALLLCVRLHIMAQLSKANSGIVGF